MGRGRVRSDRVITCRIKLIQSKPVGCGQVTLYCLGSTSFESTRMGSSLFGTNRVDVGPVSSYQLKWDWNVLTRIGFSPKKHFYLWNLFYFQNNFRFGYEQVSSKWVGSTRVLSTGIRLQQIEAGTAGKYAQWYSGRVTNISLHTFHISSSTLIINCFLYIRNVHFSSFHSLRYNRCALRHIFIFYQ